jgi:hypothetical protein
MRCELWEEDKSVRGRRPLRHCLPVRALHAVTCIFSYQHRVLCTSFDELKKSCQTSSYVQERRTELEKEINEGEDVCVLAHLQ